MHPMKCNRDQSILYKNPILILLWLSTMGGAILSVVFPQRGFSVVVGLAGVAFIVLLIRTLIRKQPFSAELPEMDFLLPFPRSFWGILTILLVGIGSMCVAGLMIGMSASFITISAFIGAGITLFWRSQLTTRMILVGLVATVIAGGGTLFLGNGDLSWAILEGIATFPLFTGGVLLVNRTNLACVRILQREYLIGARSFLWACVLAVPAALFNLLGNLQQGDTWIVHWWQPLYAIVPGVVEETWARLFLTTFCYAVLRPTTNTRPGRAIISAILIGALVHGFAHTGINPIGIIIGSLLYSVPTALLFIKCDFEYAIGYHFLIDLVRFLASVLRLSF